MLWRSHSIKMWSRTQALVSLSSAEAELYAAIKACSETLGFLSLLKDYQIHVKGKVMSDASAALGIIKRQGLGRTRHIHTSYLWIQQSMREASTSARFRVQKTVQICSPNH